MVKNICLAHVADTAAILHLKERSEAIDIHVDNSSRDSDILEEPALVDIDLTSFVLNLGSLSRIRL